MIWQDITYYRHETFEYHGNFISGLDDVWERKSLIWSRIEDGNMHRSVVSDSVSIELEREFKLKMLIDGTISN